VEKLRTQFPAYKIVQHVGGGSFKSQLKKADKSGAKLALIWGDDEVANGTVTVKHLRVQLESGERIAQQSTTLAELSGVLSEALECN